MSTERDEPPPALDEPDPSGVLATSLVDAPGGALPGDVIELVEAAGSKQLTPQQERLLRQRWRRRAQFIYLRSMQEQGAWLGPIPKEAVEHLCEQLMGIATEIDRARGAAIGIDGYEDVDIPGLLEDSREGLYKLIMWVEEHQSRKQGRTQGSASVLAAEMVAEFASDADGYGSPNPLRIPLKAAVRLARRCVQENGFPEITEASIRTAARRR